MLPTHLPKTKTVECLLAKHGRLDLPEFLLTSIKVAADLHLFHLNWFLSSLHCTQAMKISKAVQFHIHAKLRLARPQI